MAARHDRSRLGPDLSDIGARRTADRLLRALVAPDDEVLPENRFVRVTTKEGTTVTGKLLNQDAFSIQLMNPDQQLKTYLKSALRDFAIVTKGLMPSYEATLTGGGTLAGGKDDELHVTGTLQHRELRSEPLG